jgi:hypothetical protein
MRDAGEPPIHRVLRPDHCEEIRATHNLVKQRKGRKCGRSREDARERGRGTLEKHRVSDRREGGE